jgi:hypothetical protein
MCLALPGRVDRFTGEGFTPGAPADTVIDAWFPPASAAALCVRRRRVSEENIGPGRRRFDRGRGRCERVDMGGTTASTLDADTRGTIDRVINQIPAGFLGGMLGGPVTGMLLELIGVRLEDFRPTRRRPMDPLGLVAPAGARISLQAVIAAETMRLRPRRLSPARAPVVAQSSSDSLLTCHRGMGIKRGAL